MVKPGDVLYALYGATSGEVAVSRQKGAINQAILAILPRDDCDARYITAWLRKQKGYIVTTYLQGGQGNLSGVIVKNLEVFIPSLPEQQKIGFMLSHLDSLITLHQRKYDGCANPYFQKGASHAGNHHIRIAVLRLLRPVGENVQGRRHQRRDHGQISTYAILARQAHP